MPLTSPRAIEAALNQQQDEIFLRLLTIDHPDLGTPLHYVNNREDMTSNSVVYRSASFIVTRPTENERAPIAQLRVTNTTREAGNLARSISSVRRATATVDLVLAATSETIEETWAEFELRNVRWNDVQLTADIEQARFARAFWPPRRFNQTEFKGLFRR